MRKQFLHIAATLSLLLMLGVAANAQTTKQMTITVPFAFNVGEKELPAGTYNVYTTGTVSNDGFLLRSDDGRNKVVFNGHQTQSLKIRSKSRLEFRRYDEKYFLGGVWSAGNNIGRELRQSRSERKLAKQANRHLAQNAVKPEIVTVTQ
jgi:hypothetical protein